MKNVVKLEQYYSPWAIVAKGELVQVVAEVLSADAPGPSPASSTTTTIGGCTKRWRT